MNLAAPVQVESCSAVPRLNVRLCRVQNVTGAIRTFVQVPPPSRSTKGRLNTGCNKACFRGSRTACPLNIPPKKSSAIFRSIQRNNQALLRQPISREHVGNPQRPCVRLAVASIQLYWGGRSCCCFCCCCSSSKQPVTRQQKLQKEAKLAKKEAESRWGRRLRSSVAPRRRLQGSFVVHLKQTPRETGPEVAGSGTFCTQNPRHSLRGHWARMYL